MSGSQLLPTLDPVTQQFVDGLPGIPPGMIYDPDEARASLRRAQSIAVGKPRVVSEDIEDAVGVRVFAIVPRS